jgi:hypothetical protein
LGLGSLKLATALVESILSSVAKALIDHQVGGLLALAEIGNSHSAFGLFGGSCGI